MVPKIWHMRGIRKFDHYRTRIRIDTYICNICVSSLFFSESLIRGGYLWQFNFTWHPNPSPLIMSLFWLYTHRNIKFLNWGFYRYFYVFEVITNMTSRCDDVVIGICTMHFVKIYNEENSIDDERINSLIARNLYLVSD